jgi:hypothetical protein
VRALGIVERRRTADIEQHAHRPDIEALEAGVVGELERP